MKIFESVSVGQILEKSAAQVPDKVAVVDGEQRDGYDYVDDMLGLKKDLPELECLLVEHPKVEQVCMVATPNPVLGESICACVISKSNQTITLKRYAI